MTAAETRLPHALLFAGPMGVGKRELADLLAARLLCEAPRQPHEPACGNCPSCVMMASGQHPDYRLLQPDAAAEGEDEGESAAAGEAGDKKKASKQIRIQQVREVEAFFHVSGHRGGARVCVIDPAEAMNPITANSLLKILEEPSVSFYFIMISHRWRRLLPTLLSRSRRVMFAPPPDEQSQRWLAERQLADQAKWLPFFGHAPLAVAEAARTGRLKALESVVADLLKPQEALAQANRWENLVKADGALGMEELVSTVQKWLFDLGQCAVAASPRYFPQQNKTLSAISQRLSLPVLIQAQQQVFQLRAWSNHPLNARLFLEDLCVRAFRPLGL
ncbi:MAG: DNA polymerase III subunit delta' [Rhodocyclaceae bacterium]|nr:DNA polymerase III subunit delta' [Rhodocyclaceae bacterium]MDP1957518.1 DNA polymerase III subunit delta' [Rhodocyclaceae bacterium]